LPPEVLADPLVRAMVEPLIPFLIAAELWRRIQPTPIPSRV